MRLHGEQHGHWAPQFGQLGRCSPALSASLASSSRPEAPALPGPVLPQPFPPGGRLASRLHTARENKPDCQAASSRQHPGPGLGFFFRGLLRPPRSVPVRLAAALAEEEQGALPSVCGCRCLPGAPAAPRAPSGRPKAAGGRESGRKPCEAPGSPAGAPPAWLLPGPAAEPPPPLEGAGSALSAPAVSAAGGAAGSAARSWWGSEREAARDG